MEGGRWSPIVPCREGPKLSHLFFADDLILMGKATITTARAIKKVMDQFSTVSGLKVSPTKSKVFFSKRGGSSMKNNICSILGYGRTNRLEKYLGIQVQHGRVDRETHAALLDKVLTRLSGWKSKFLSLAGRATLI